MNSTQPFAGLQPDTIMDAVEQAGYVCDARIFPLNSYENRVYQIGLDDATPIIGKFYRPGRWTDAAILEEHRYTQALAELEIPVVAPLSDHHPSLLHFGDFRFALYPRQGGHTPELDNTDTLAWLGRFMGRIHRVGASQAFQHRPSLDVQSYVIEPSDYILNEGFIADYLQDAYRSLIADLIPLLQQRFQDVPFQPIRLHGDCHASNILWTEQGPHFVDFDDCRMGPAIQDLWMLLSGSQQEQREQLEHVLRGYEEFHDFNPAETRLIEPLRTLRLVHYAGWLARRWHDPSFPINFPWFGEARYWEEHILELREQLSLLQDSGSQLIN